MSTETARLQLKVGGMACSFCATSITKGLTRIEGVTSAHVSIAHEEALIEYMPARLTEDRIKQTLLDLGYTIRDPRRVKAYEEQQKEIDLERRRLWEAGVMTGLALLQMGAMWLHVVNVATLSSIMTVGMPLLAVLTVFGPGAHILRMAWQSLRRGILNQHVLLEFGAFSGLLGGAAGFVGRYAHVPNFRFPAPDFLAVATFITTYHILSAYTSLLVRTKASRSVMKLLALQPALATVLREGIEQEVPVEAVNLGERVRVRPGASIPLDGRVVDGLSGVNQSLVTGEALPVDKGPGAEVIGGSLNLTGMLVIEVTRVGEDSFLHQIARQIEDARARKPGILQLVDRVLAVYVPGVLVAAALAVLIWTVGAYAVAGHVAVMRGIQAMLAVFVMGYPCALGMATPLAMIRGGGMAAEQGILIRSGEAFQALKDVQRVALDKTGTLTEGRPSVSGVESIAGLATRELLRLAAAAEAPSEHPLGQAIVARAAHDALALPAVKQFRAVPGQGVEVTVDGHAVVVGSPRFLRDQGIDVTKGQSRVETWQEAGNTVVGVVQDGVLLGWVAIADTIKADAREVVQRLQAMGLQPIMLTGDNARTAETVAQAVGITEFRADVLPDDKAAVIRSLQQGSDPGVLRSRGRSGLARGWRGVRADGVRVMMVGDGINDAPALTQADVGVAIGAGTDIAIESADVVLMGDRLTAVADAVDIGRRAYRKTAQNISLAFAFNGIGVPLALTGLVDPSWAMLAMVASVSAVLINSFAGGRPLAGPRKALAIGVAGRSSAR